MFLYNPDAGTDFESDLTLSGELTNKLVEKRRSNSSIKIDFITDPDNTLYGGSPSKQIADFEKAGVNMIISDLRKLRDSNPLYSSAW